MENNRDLFELIVVYYGDTQENIDRYLEITPHVLCHKGFQYQNAQFAYFTYLEQITRASYDYIFVLDDDLLFQKQHTFSCSGEALRLVANQCSMYRPRIGHISASIRYSDTLHTIPWFHLVTGNRQGLQAPRNTPYAEMNNLLFRSDIFSYVMDNMPGSSEIDSWGYDLYFYHLVSRLPRSFERNEYDASNIVILDSVEYINPTPYMKGLKTRIIEDCAPKRIDKWTTFVKKYNIPIFRFPSPPIDKSTKLKPFTHYTILGSDKYHIKMKSLLSEHFPGVKHLNSDQESSLFITDDICTLPSSRTIQIPEHMIQKPSTVLRLRFVLGERQ